MNIFDVIEAQRQALRNREAATLKLLATNYATIARELQGTIDALAKEIQGLFEQRIEPGPSLIYRLERYQVLLNQTRAQLRNFAIDSLGSSLIDSTRDAIELAQNHARQLILAGINPPPSITLNLYGLPAQATNNLIAATNAGPLATILNSFGDVASIRMRETLITGLATGDHPYVIARHLTRQVNIGFTRAALIARTETLRAYRESHRQTYQQNSHLVDSWVWHASLGPRTCAACLAMHGSVHPLAESMASHPACRCTQVPKTKTWRELGFNVSDENETSIQVPSGASEFAKWSISDQIKVLGPAAQAAYANGEVELQDFVRINTSPQWGSSVQVASLAQARRNAEQRQRFNP